VLPVPSPSTTRSTRSRLEGPGSPSLWASEKMNLLSTRDVTHALATCSYWARGRRSGNDFSRPFRRIRQGLYRPLWLFPGDARQDAGFGFGPLLQKMAWTIHSRISGKAVPPTGSGSPRPSDPRAARREEPRHRRTAAPPRLLPRHGRSRSPRRHAIRRCRGQGRQARERSPVLAMRTDYLPISLRTNMHELIAGKEAVRRAFAEPGSP